MIVVGLKNQLGNQMFQYAAIKTIAQDRGLEFRCFSVPTEKKYVNSIDEKYGSFLGKLFDIPEEEILNKKPKLNNIYSEAQYVKGYDFGKSYFPEVMQIEDNTIIDGHFESLKYFLHDRNDVISWFKFHEDIMEKCDANLQEIRMKYNNRPLVSVHFRAGRDFTIHGYTINKEYWVHAALEMRQMLDNPVFLCFYDRPSASLNYFCKKIDCIGIHGSLIEDMYMIQACDAHIICNSTFSVMSSFIDPKDSITICPSVYPILIAYKDPTDYFMSDWIPVKAKRSFKASFYNCLQWINIRVIKKILFKTKFTRAK